MTGAVVVRVSFLYAHSWCLMKLMFYEVDDWFNCFIFRFDVMIIVKCECLSSDTSLSLLVNIEECMDYEHWIKITSVVNGHIKIVVGIRLLAHNGRSRMLD